MRSGDGPAEAMVAESIRDEQTVDRPGEQPVQPAIGRPGEGTDEPTVHPALDDLQLGRAAERVLRLMLDDRRRTVAEISSALALPSSSTSRAVQELAARGLVIGPGGYGAKLGLGALGPAVRTYRVGLERAATARSERLQQLEEAWASVGGRWPDDGDVVLPYGDGLDPLDLLRPERSYLAAFGARTLVWEPPVMKQPDRARRRGIDSRIVLAEGARLEFRMGSPLRRTSEDIATFRVVDGIRAGVVFRKRGRMREAWTFDPLHARALTRLFAVLWADALPVDDRGRFTARPTAAE